MKDYSTWGKCIMCVFIINMKHILSKTLVWVSFVARQKQLLWKIWVNLSTPRLLSSLYKSSGWKVIYYALIMCCNYVPLSYTVEAPRGLKPSKYTLLTCHLFTLFTLRESYPLKMCCVCNLRKKQKVRWP